MKILFLNENYFLVFLPVACKCQLSITISKNTVSESPTIYVQSILTSFQENTFHFSCSVILDMISFYVFHYHYLEIYFLVNSAKQTLRNLKTYWSRNERSKFIFDYRRRDEKRFWMRCDCKMSKQKYGWRYHTWNKIFTCILFSKHVYVWKTMQTDWFVIQMTNLCKFASLKIYAVMKTKIRCKFLWRRSFWIWCSMKMMMNTFTCEIFWI